MTVDVLLPTAQPRQRLHQRLISLQGFKREDGLWDIEGHLTDIKDYDFGHVTRVHPAGVPVHDMRMRITIDSALTIIDAEAAMSARPYAGQCETITPEYKKLIGLRIAPGFTNAVRKVLGGTRGCAHLTEMVSALATAAFQTLASEINEDVSKLQPTHLDRCHALRLEGPVVQHYYPAWFKKA
jgi:hypothetical protein